jgi:hypothetical protein
VEIISRPRRSGKTTFLIEYMRKSMDTKYLLVVHSVQRRDDLRHTYPDLSNRIISSLERETELQKELNPMQYMKHHAGGYKFNFGYDSNCNK